VIQHDMKKLLVGAVGTPCSGKCRKPQERIVSRKFALFSVLTLVLWLLGASANVQAQPQFDAETAKALAKRNDCFKCHAIAKTKKGPPYQRIVARLRSKPDGVEVIVEHITSGRMVQQEDGTDE
jgi:cytochrome c